MYLDFGRTTRTVFCVATIAAAAYYSRIHIGPHGTLLTDDSFNSTISTGIWLVLHTSPFCYHCHKFAPTWAELEKKAGNGSLPGVRLAVLDCANGSGTYYRLLQRLELKGAPAYLLECSKNLRHEWDKLLSYSAVIPWWKDGDGMYV
jgi:thiol-disulfide isomerase/thioredoxin